MTPAPPTRHSLILRLRDREDAQSWQEFADIYEPVIYRVAKARGMQHADALELVQRVLMAVARAVDRFQPDQKRANIRITDNNCQLYLCTSVFHPWPISFFACWTFPGMQVDTLAISPAQRIIHVIANCGQARQNASQRQSAQIPGTSEINESMLAREDVGKCEAPGPWRSRVASTVLRLKNLRRSAS